MDRIAYLAIMLHFSVSKGVQRDQDNIAAVKKKKKKKIKRGQSVYYVIHYSCFFGSLSV